MLLLGIETSTRRVGVALASENGMLARVELGGHADVGPPRHAEQLTPAIEYCCAQLDTTLDRVSAIAVGIGPGMFTGLRVGVTTAKALAQVLRVPMIPVPSLDLLAYPLRHSKALIVPAIDARRNELYYALYRTVHGGVQRASEFEVGSVAELVTELEARGEDTLVCGDGALRYATELGEVEHVEIAGAAHAAPSLAALAELARGRYEREEFCTADDVLPLYLRKSDAELAWDRKGR
jgi:tRNA threonylcarbamoyladenosine biosynthesis protein TsaB